MPCAPVRRLALIHVATDFFGSNLSNHILMQLWVESQCTFAVHQCSWIAVRVIKLDLLSHRCSRLRRSVCLDGSFCSRCLSYRLNLPWIRFFFQLLLYVAHNIKFLLTFFSYWWQWIWFCHSPKLLRIGIDAFVLIPKEHNSRLILQGVRNGPIQFLGWCCCLLICRVELVPARKVTCTSYTKTQTHRCIWSWKVETFLIYTQKTYLIYRFMLSLPHFRFMDNCSLCLQFEIMRSLIMEFVYIICLDLFRLLSIATQVYFYGYY